MDPIATHAARQPDRPALIEGDRQLSWRELETQRNRLAHSLVRLGVTPGSHVVIHSLNSLEHLVAGAAVRAAGAVPVPMNHRLVAEEVAYILDNSDAVAVFVGEAFLPVAEAVRPDAGKVRAWILMGRAERRWAHGWEALLAAGGSGPVVLPTAGFGRSIIYTGGTTGRPKGAIRGAVNPQDVLAKLAALNVSDPAHVHLVAGPLYHSAPAGFAVYAQLVGATVVVMSRFDPEQALATIERHRCSSTFMAPTLLQRIVDLPPEARRGYDVSSMRAIIVAAAPCPMRVKEAVLDHFGPVLYEFYGSTELGINTVLRPEDMLRRPGSCGRAAPGIEIRILDDQGRPVPLGTPGELHIRRSPGVFEGYWKDPEATRQTERGEWLTVGDVAWVDAEGFVYICDRKRDMIISAGVNIYPAEIEDVLHRHPAVEDVAVFGVPDDEWGERVHAALRLRPGARLTREEVQGFCRQHVAGYKVPRQVSFHEELPRDASGKLLKRLLREPYWTGRPTRV